MHHHNLRTCLFIGPLCLLLLSCGGPGKRVVIGVSQCSQDIWRDKLNTELQIGTFLYDNVQLRLASANDDNKRQIKQINKFIDEGVDLLVVAPNQVNTISSAIDRAYQKGIPVIVFDRKTDTDKYTAFIGADNYFIGRTMARFVAARLNGRGHVVELRGLNGSSPEIDRHRGFADEMEKYPGITIIDSRYTDWTKPAGKAAMDSVLALRQDVDCVFAHNDRIAQGAREAVKEAGIDRDIIYTGIDALSTENGGMRLVKAGRLAASYTYPTRGDLVIQLAMNILEGKPYERNNYLQSTIVTEENVDAMLLQADEMDIQQEKLIKLHDQVGLYLAQYHHQIIYELLFGIIILLLVGFLFYVYRATTQKRRLAEDAANAKLQFFTNVSHEFRTPLTLIADPVDRLLESKSLSKEQAGLLSLVQRNVGVMLKLTNELLDFRKVQNGKMTVQVACFDLAENVRAWARSFMPSAGKRKIAIRLDVPDRLVVRSDHYKIERICYNLLSNALKYTGEQGNIRITLKEENDGMFCLEVADDGVGMPDETLSRVFDRFYQAKGSQQGTGIGLALVKAFSELLGGHVAVASKQGEGTTFTVTLPVRVEGQNEECNASAVPRDVLPPSTFKQSLPVAGSGTKTGDKVADLEKEEDKPRVLIIDDNADVLDYISSLLEPAYMTATATDGKTGLERAVKEVPDLVISDVMMPVMDGMELCGKLKKEMATNHIPVLLLTAKSGDDCRAEGYGCGADAYITKPFSSKVLMARIKNLLDNRRLLKDYFTGGELDDTRPKDAGTLFLDNLKSMITERMADSAYSVEDLASQIGLSRVQLYRKVKALTGASPVELIRAARLRKADRLLKTSGMTIAEICYATGFSSPSYFTKCYKDYFGRTPSGALDKKQ
ncbi:MAG: substrate-binding domain-containing protein [Prevotellaceae bacterium]|nr:substrate-binding domain-containing protein [Prevotellaceae bacterium]